MMYPLRFVPTYQYRLWGGRRLEGVFGRPLPGHEPIGEAWLLSDRPDHASQVAEGLLEGRTLGQLMAQYAEPLMGTMAGRFASFPLLLKFLDAKQMLSVQVHPSDAYPELLPAGETGKTEAWVVLSRGPGGRVYAGLKPGATRDTLQRAVTDGTLANELASFAPKPGDAVFISAGTVHSLGDDVVVFEVQQNSDVTFRLFDWNHVDRKTGQPRPLQVAEALACIYYAKGPVLPVVPRADAATHARETLFDCRHFSVWRTRTADPFAVGSAGVPRVLVCIDGVGHVEHRGAPYATAQGDVMLLPAEVGVCAFRPKGAVTLLEIALPEARA
jgi:mannose-6-phosphate isomerase